MSDLDDFYDAGGNNSLDNFAGSFDCMSCGHTNTSASRDPGNKKLTWKCTKCNYVSSCEFSV